MSYGVSAALQVAVFDQLSSDSALAGFVGDNIFDALPSGVLPSTYVSIGPEKVRDAGDGDGSGAWHEFTISVVSDSAGFHSAKQAAGAVSDALHRNDLTLSRGRLVGLWFLKAQALRQSSGTRRIDLSFRARVEDE